MQAEHLFCPKCGYDLHGIPEARCPECGFGYDHAAIRDLAEAADRARVNAARTVMVRAAVAGVLSAPVFVAALGATPFAVLAATAAVCLALFVTLIVATDLYKSTAPLPGLLLLFVAFGCLLIVVSAMSPHIVLIPVLILLAHGWYSRLFKWGTLAPAGNVLTPGLRRQVLRYSGIGTGMLLAVSATILFFWLTW